MRKNEVSGVLFDLWNTIIVPEGPKLSKQVAEIIGIQHDEILEFMRFTSSINSSFQTLDVAQSLFRAKYGCELPEEKCELLIIRESEFIDSVKIIDGAIDFFGKCKNSNLKIGIISNATAVSKKILMNLDLGSIFDFIALSCDAGYLKPDPRFFLEYSREWMLDSDQVCVVGDKITTDILGAKMADMQAIWFNPSLDYLNSAENIDLRGIVSDYESLHELIFEK